MSAYLSSRACARILEWAASLAGLEWVWFGGQAALSASAIPPKGLAAVPSSCGFFFFFLIRKRFWPLHCRLQAFSGCGVQASRCRGFRR